MALFGEVRIHRDWNDPHACLRDRGRRAVARERYLSRCGYLRLLRGA